MNIHVIKFYRQIARGAEIIARLTELALENDNRVWEYADEHNELTNEFNALLKDMDSNPNYNDEIIGIGLVRASDFLFDY